MASNNYIHRLQDDLAAEQAENESLREGIGFLIDYLNSDKFRGGIENDYVRPIDVITRLRDIRSAGTDAHFAKLNELVRERREA